MVLKKVGSKFLPTTESGKRLLKKPTTKAKAKKRLRQVEFFKNRDKKK